MLTSRKLVTVIAVVALVSAGCTGGGNGDNGGNGGGSSTGGHLILGTLSNIDTLNPFRTFQQNSYATFEYIYPQLVQMDLKTLDFVPDFATSWETSADGLDVDLPHDAGREVVGRGAPHGGRRRVHVQHDPEVRGRSRGNLVAGLANVTSVKATDTNTARPHVLRAGRERPVEPAADSRSSPQHVWGQYATGDGTGLRQFPNTPTEAMPLMSGGPFELASTRRTRWRSSSATRTSTGLRRSIDGFGLQYFSNDDSMVQALRNGDIQAAIGVPVTAVRR